MVSSTGLRPPYILGLAAINLLKRGINQIALAGNLLRCFSARLMTRQERHRIRDGLLGNFFHNDVTCRCVYP